MLPDGLEGDAACDSRLLYEDHHDATAAQPTGYEELEYTLYCGPAMHACAQGRKMAS